MIGILCNGIHVSLVTVKSRLKIPPAIPKVQLYIFCDQFCNVHIFKLYEQMSVGQYKMQQYSNFQHQLNPVINS